MVIDYNNLDLKSMTPEEIESLQRKYLVEELGKNLIDSEERDDRKSPTGYRVLAMKYWPEEFADGKRKHVHHINFNRSDNRVCNLVVLTPSEHRLIHSTFDLNTQIKYEESGKKISQTLTGRKLSPSHCANIGKVQSGKPKGPCKESTKLKIGKANSGKNNGMYGKGYLIKGKVVGNKGMHWYIDQSTGRRVYYK